MICSVNYLSCGSPGIVSLPHERTSLCPAFVTAGRRSPRRTLAHLHGVHLAVLDHLRIARCHLYGQCIGGAVTPSPPKAQPPCVAPPRGGGGSPSSSIPPPLIGAAAGARAGSTT